VEVFGVKDVAVSFELFRQYSGTGGFVGMHRAFAQILSAKKNRQAHDREPG
jgi:hypothetical protein